MTTTRHIVLIIALCAFIPPLGLILLMVYLLVRASREAGKGGGIVVRDQFDRWAQEEPWWTGNEEADMAELQRRMTAARILSPVHEHEVPNLTETVTGVSVGNTQTGVTRYLSRTDFERMLTEALANRDRREQLR